MALLCGITLSLGLVSMSVAQAEASGPSGCASPSHPVLRPLTTCLISDRVIGTNETVAINIYTNPLINGVAITAGSDGALWFTDPGGAIGSITTNGVVSTYSGSGISEPDGIAAGSDGALWFTNFLNGSVGRITTSGVISNFPNSASQPQGITAGPDGALWYTNELSNSINRITTGGDVSSYGGYQSGVADPEGITTGSDGALWFTNGSNEIGRITTAGVITFFSDPSIDNPQDITAGPDGALWFTNNGNNSIGRITTAGVVTNYTDPSIDEPFSITDGPDGNLWFTNSGNNSIGMITTKGVVTSYTAAGIDTVDRQSGITTGPDGALWFTNGDNSIGQVVLKPRAPTISGIPPSPTEGGAPYYFAFALTGVPTPTVSLKSGTLPPDLTLSSDGVIAGTPTALGTYTATLTAKNGQTPGARETFTITVVPVPPGISGTPTTNVSAGSAYSFQFTLNGFPAPITGITSGALPPGLSLSPEGAITGTPSEAGTYEAEVTATNGYPPDATEDISITVDPALTLSPSSGDPGTQVTLNGAGFEPGESVAVHYVVSPHQRATLCPSTSVLGDGTFSCLATIPAGRKAGWDGNHNFLATGLSSRLKSKAVFVLTNGVEQPTLSVYPSTELRGNQTLFVSGTRWMDGTVAVSECTSGFDVVCHRIADPQANRGDWEISYRAIIGNLGTKHNLGLCGVVGGSQVCQLEATQESTTISAPLPFLPLTVSILPRKLDNVYHNARLVTIDISNFPSYNQIEIELCPNEPGSQCSEYDNGTTNGNGFVSFTDYPLICFSGDCNIVAIDNSYGKGFVAASVEFTTFGLGEVARLNSPSSISLARNTPRILLLIKEAR